MRLCRKEQIHGQIERLRKRKKKDKVERERERERDLDLDLVYFRACYEASPAGLVQEQGKMQVQ